MQKAPSVPVKETLFGVIGQWLGKRRGLPGVFAPEPDERPFMASGFPVIEISLPPIVLT